MSQSTDVDRRQLTDEQLEILSQLQGDLGPAVDQLLRERGVPVRVSSIQFVPVEPAATSAEFADIGPDPSVSPIQMPPPGGVYMCWQEQPGGAWVCVCGAPEVLSSGG